MLELIIACILGLAVGFGSAWLIIRILPQNKIREINYEKLQYEQEQFNKLRQEEEEQRRAHQQLLINQAKEADELDLRCKLLNEQKNILDTEVSQLAGRRIELERSVEQAQRQAEYAGATFYKQQMDLVNANLDHALLELSRKFQRLFPKFNYRITENVETHVIFGK